MLDYALRNGGWLDEFREKDATEILVAEENDEIIGFSILSQKTRDCAEFRIALHPHRLGHGRGKAIALLTLFRGFSHPEQSRICLIVRKNNPRAQRLYESLHFRPCGECTELVQGEPVAFLQMEIDRNTFEGAGEP